MVGGVQTGKRSARVQLDREAHRIQRAARRMLHRRRDARRVRHLVRVRRPPGTRRWPRDRRTRNVAGADDHWKPQAELPRVVSDGLLVLDLDADRGAGRNVRHRRGEDVGPFLLDEARAPAVLLGLLVLRLRGGSLLDDALDQSVADLHAQVVDRRVLGQGKDVDAFRPRLTGIRELLTDRGARHDTGHDDADVGLERRGWNKRVLLGAAPEQRALGDAVRAAPHVTGGLGPGGRSRQGEREDETQHDETSTAPHGPDYRSPAGEVMSACFGSTAAAPATAAAGAAAASLRNSRCTRRLSSWHSLPGSSHRAPSRPIVTILIDVSGTPKSMRKRFTTVARRSARLRLYSTGPWLSV